jgi:hypothetical protein
MLTTRAARATESERSAALLSRFEQPGYLSMMVASRPKGARRARHGQVAELTTQGRLALVGAPVVVVAITVIALVIVTSSIRDPATEWTAIGATLAGAATLVAVVGLPVAIWQLMLVQQEQERLIIQLAAQPQIDVGFLSMQVEEGEGLQKSFIVEKPAGPNHVVSTFLPIRAVNRGQRSARNPTWTLVFPSGVHPKSVNAGDVVRVGGLEGRLELVARDLVLHPEDVRPLDVRFDVPHDCDEFVIDCRWTLDDAPPVEGPLRVLIRSFDDGDRPVSP